MIPHSVQNSPLSTGIRMAAATIVLLEVILMTPAHAGSRLAPCPDSPNCVSSLADSGRHTIAPLPLRGSPEQTIECLRAIIAGMQRTRFVTQDPEFLHVEFRSLLGFVDDVAFEVDRRLKVIQVRSASRLGYWDLGVNRRRVERIRAALESFTQTAAP